ncbi:histidine kinase [Streptomonospora sp. PA3]|uniref:MHYT domain-containing protein n=1 Tax=Streptomonospora sp. PA3 TaxID=2607326 RepID=UPI0012DC92E8|nr:MHYT domain-containing protein [Streptomonospora sp. PA3]MUL40661.1 histidine kinase [Streptomonospora sp. PA3]
MIDHFAYGWTTPALAYAVSFLGSLIGLQAARRARRGEGAIRAGWLAVAAFTLGSAAIWATHFIAMLGMSVSSTTVRYDVLLAVLSALVAVAVVGAALLWCTTRRPGPTAVLGGGAVMGLGAASMHHLATASIEMQARMDHDLRYFAAAVAIAVAASAAALLFALRLRGTPAAVGASLIMAAGVSAMHYTAAAGARVTTLPDTPFDAPPTGATMMDFFLPVFVGLGLLLMIISLILLLSPAEDDEPRPVRGRPPRHSAFTRRH